MTTLIWISSAILVVGVIIGLLVAIGFAIASFRRKDGDDA